MPHFRVLAGPSLDPSELVPITSIVNSNQSHRLESDVFEGQVVVNIKGLNDSENDAEYFSREDRQGITWSIQVQGRFLKPRSADDILFGNTFERPLNLPWGSGAALSFMKYIDPTLDHDLASQSKPWALSPLISTMPHFSHAHLSRPTVHPRSSSSSLDSLSSTESDGAVDDEPAFPPKTSLKDDTSHLRLIENNWSPASSTTSLSSSSSRKSASSIFSKRRNKTNKKRHIGEKLGLTTANDRRSFFASQENRQKVFFGPKDVVTTDFCYGFLEFSPTLSLRLPGGISFDLMRYWDGQPVQFVCCERKQEGDSEPWGRVFWAIVIELCEEDVVK